MNSTNTQIHYSHQTRAMMLSKSVTTKPMRKYYCGNCGLEGHIYKECDKPIMSIGVIAYRRDSDGRPLYLLIRRKDTYAYVDFLRGKYSLDNINTVKKLLMNMTQSERESILTMDFEGLWKKLWQIDKITDHRSEYEASKNKYMKLFNGTEYVYYTLTEETRTRVCLQGLLEETQCQWQEPEWGFPKGRRNLKESDIDCAKREFEEETNSKDTDYRIDETIPPLIEEYVSDNGLTYQHIYYVAEWCSEKTSFEIDTNSPNQSNEISAVEFHSYDSCMNRFRPYNKERILILSQLNTILARNNIKTVV